MLIVIPVGPSDAPNLELLTKAIIRLGFIQSQVLFVHVPSVKDAVDEAASILSDVSPSVSVVSTENEFASPWPIGPDRMFLWTVKHLDTIGNTQPWLWLEADTCPLKPHWDKLLRDEYHANGKPYYGFTRPTVWKTPDGKIEFREGDNMLLGVAIYPADMMRDQELVPLLNDLGHSDPRIHSPVPWDIYLRWIMFRRGVHSTQLICDRWRTCNYVRDEFDSLSYEPAEGNDREEGGLLPDEAVIVHGCKDGSLQRLVIGEEAIKAVSKEALVETIIKTLEKPKSFDSPYTTSFDSPDTIIPGNTPLVKAWVKAATQHDLLLGAIIKEKRPRIGALVAATGIAKEEMQKMLPAIGYEMIAAGWVKKIETK